MSTPDTQLIEKLRQENVEQFFILVRMHLSFVVDINTDDVDCSTDKPKQFRWNFNKKTKTSSVASSQNNTFTSKSISETNAITEEGISRLNELIDFLSKPTNVTQEGIFRRTGSLSRQQELRQLLQAGSNLGLDDGKFSVHDCASVLKGFLAELPQPLLMDQYYQTYCTLAVISFMIRHSARLFDAPNQLVTDAAAYFALRERKRIMSPDIDLDESITDRTAATTVYTFVDQHRTRAENETNPTDTALAQLKDVSHKSIVLKNLAQKMASTESLDDDYESDASNSSTLSEGALNKSKKMSPKFVSEPNLSAIDANDETPKNTKKRSRLFRSKVVSHSKKYQKRASARASCVSCVDHDSDNDVFVTETPSKNENYADGLEFKVHLTSTPGLCEAVFDDSTPYSEFRTSMSPITQSTQKLSKAMQAAASKSFGDSIKRHIFNKGLLNKTPKKGSSSAINTIEEKTKTKFKYSDDSKDVSHKSIVLKNLAQKMASTESLDDDYESDASNSSTLSEGALNKSKKMSPKFVSEPNLSAIDANDETPKNTKKRSRLFRSKVVSHSKKYQKRASARASCVSCVDHDSDNDVFVTETPSKNENYADGLEFKVHLTSTPGLCEAVFDDSTPYSEFRTSMSPITQSTQKLSKAMQESIMTPRSRKPLILTCEQRESMPESERDDVSDIYRSQSLSPRNDSDFVSSEDDVTRSSGDSICPVRYQTSKWYTSTEKHLGLNTTLCGIDDLPQTNTHIPEEQSLSQPFKDYLLSRSVLTATPIDLSMLNKSSDDERISDSLLYCLDGNVPSDLASSISNLAVDSSVSQLRSPLKSIKNIDLSPSRKRCGSTTDLGTDSKKVIIEKENLNEAFELRETDL
ncbi:unnamed protein product [Leptidea sinapis]|uniref:Rho-GAP domain-containing protein n=1 Tax=Leptidea sinapis TaxID=189913 RepID=A0A5E4QQ30_9NEOP|nr:unnamed protein product [Leptidea sinapis]